MYTFQKLCTENYEMDIGESKPLLIEKGTPVVLPIFAIQNDSTYWENPHIFNPDRFLNNENTDRKSTNNFFQFGDGPRMCPGNNENFTIDRYLEADHEEKIIII